jgi:thiol-disulfide isomerase/thioredoxin
MRILRGLPGLVVLVTAGLSGCSQTSGLRPDQGSDLKTVASVGDKPLPVRAGAVDSSVRSGVPEPIVASTGGKISGRVYDDQGQPVTDARVRLAVGSERGGKAVSATTDRSGAFTLRGLRLGSSYTVIAEYQGRDGPQTGRTQAEAPESNVRIALKRPAPSREDSRTSARPSRSRVAPASTVEEEDPDAEADSRFNREDVDPPAPEADRVGRKDSPAGDRDTPRQGGGWSRNRGGGTKKQPPQALDPDEEEQNPLPPAIGSDRVGSTEDETAEDGIRLARGRGAPRSSDDEAPATESFAPAARSLSPESYGPIQMSDPDARSAPEPRAGGRTTTAPASSRPALRPTPAASPERPRPTWGELSFMKPSIPLDESLQRTAGTRRGAAPQPLAAAAAPPAAAGPASALASPLAGGTGPACRFDPGERRLDDFLLPDPLGRMVSFREFGADLILLDFWGTWCAPCRKSIGHLVEIQKKLGGRRIQVIGIACEKPQPTGRNDKVLQAMAKEGINYPVLVSSMDGKCPVQEAFQVQFYPTLVLLDRQGRILWREQGATDVTLSRMDRFIARNLNLGGGPEEDPSPPQVARSSK